MSSTTHDEKGAPIVTEPSSAEPQPEAELTPEEYLEQRSAQAMVATYLQMARYAKLARALQRARLRSTQRRLARAADPEEILRLRQQLYAQNNQGASLDGAVARFRRRAADLRSFPEAGLSHDDLTALGLDDLLADEEEQGDHLSWDEASRSELNDAETDEAAHAGASTHGVADDASAADLGDDTSADDV
jgi:hypothetical protein